MYKFSVNSLRVIQMQKLGLILQLGNTELGGAF